MKSLFVLLLLVLAFALPVHGDAPVPARPAPAPKTIVPPPPPIPGDLLDRHTFKVSPVERTGKGQYRIGEIVVNATDKTISFPAVVNLDKGLLEYLLVRSGGKTHESLLRTSIEPYNLQVACLLLGLSGTDKPLPFQGSADLPSGDPVDIIILTDPPEGMRVQFSPKDLLIQDVNGVKRDITALKWVFTGSIVSNGRFAAQSDGSIIALYHDPVAMIDNASPGGENDEIWFVREGAVPAVGTPVIVTIKAAGH